MSTDNNYFYFVLYLKYFVYFTLDKWHLNITLTLREEVARPALAE